MVVKKKPAPVPVKQMETAKDRRDWLRKQAGWPQSKG